MNGRGLIRVKRRSRLHRRSTGQQAPREGKNRSCGRNDQAGRGRGRKQGEVLPSSVRPDIRA